MWPSCHNWVFIKSYVPSASHTDHVGRMCSREPEILGWDLGRNRRVWIIRVGVVVRQLKVKTVRGEQRFKDRSPENAST